MYYNFYEFIKDLSVSETEMFNLVKKIDKINFDDNIRGVIKFDKSVFNNLLKNIDKNISAYNKGFQEDYISFSKVSSSSKEYVAYFDKPVYVKNLKLAVDDFFYELSVEKPLTNFEVFLETDSNQTSFFAIPYTHSGDYIELVKLNESENKSKFKCKNSYSFKVYDRSFKLINDNAIRIGADGYINIPSLSGDEAYIMYTPQYDSYEYSINRMVQSIFIKTNIDLDSSRIKMYSY